MVFADFCSLGLLVCDCVARLDDIVLMLIGDRSVHDCCIPDQTAALSQMQIVWPLAICQRPQDTKLEEILGAV